MLELSCSDYTFPLLGRNQVLALLHLLAFNYVDIGLFDRNPNFLPSDLMACPGQFIDRVRSDLEDAFLRPSDVFLQVGNDPTQISANDPSQSVRQQGRDAFRRTLDLCFGIRCTHLTGLPGVWHGEPSHDLALAVEEAAWRVNTAANAGVTYSVEPHLGSICSSTKITHELLSQVGGLTLTLDYGHFICQGESNAAIHTLLPYASHVHLRGAAPGRLQTSAAESTIDVRYIVDHLSAGYNGRLALEYVWSDWHGCNRTDNLSETILLRRHITELQANQDTGAPHNV